MKFHFAHCNINVTDLEKSKAFYQEALGLHVYRESQHDGFTLCFMADEKEQFFLELTCLKDHPQPYDLGENESHICLCVDDMKAAHDLHEKLGCICFENKDMGIYFIHDPDYYWIEIVPVK